MDLKKQALVHKFAQDFVDRASQTNQLAHSYEEVSRLLDVFEETRLQAVLTLDTFSDAEKIEVLDSLRSTNNTEINRLFDTLIAENELTLFEPVLREIGLKISEKTQIFDMEVIVAQPLTKEQKERIRQIIETKFGIKTHHLIETLDPSILGGFIIKVNNQIIDASVRSQIQELKQKL